jgi:tetratricopeptide (TPR) repeat protein
MTETVQVGEGGQKNHAPRKWFVVVLIVTVVLAVGAGVAVSWWVNNETEEPPLVKEEPLPELPSAVTEVQTLLAAGKTQEAEQVAKEAIANPATSDNDKHLLYIELGKVYVDRGDYQAAADAYTQAWNIKETFELASKLGSTWQSLGDNTKAVKYYKKALELNPKDSPTNDSDGRVLQQMIDALESGQ